MSFVKKIMGNDSNLSDAGWFLKAATLWDRNIAGYSNPLKAIEYLSHSIKLNNKKVDAYHKRGIAYLQINEYDKSIYDFTCSIQISEEINEENFSPYMSYIMRSNAFFAKKMTDKAIRDLEIASSIEPYDPVSYTSRASIYVQIGKFNEAINEYNKIIHLYPENDMYYYVRGYQYAEINDYKNAIIDFNTAININNRNPAYYIERGKAFFKIGDNQRACNDFKMASDIGDPDFLLEAKKKGLCNNF